MSSNSSSENLLFRGTSTFVASIPLTDITPDPDRSILQENLTTLTSYSLIPGERGAIIVPGCPPIWSSPPLPATVPADNGPYKSDPTGYMFPHCPLEPFFRALAITKPAFDLSEIDFISDRRNLRLLRWFVDVGTKPENNKSFRMDIEVVGKTVMLSRWQPEHIDVVNEFRGYGREFEKVFTKEQREVKGSITHNRAVTYTLGGLRLVVRFKVEGYIPGYPAGSVSKERYKGPPYKTMKELNPKLTPTGYRVQIKGKFIPSSQLLEIKTGYMGKDLEERSVDQMWFSRTRVLCAGHWERNKGFTSVEQVDMLQGGKIDKWAMENERSLRGLVRVLEIVAEVVRRKEGRYALVREESSSKLEILEIKDEYPLAIPEDVKERWRKT